MGKYKIKAWLSIRTKVLVPVVVVMIAIVAVSMALVERNIRKQLEVDADNTIISIDSNFRAVVKFREEQLINTFKNVVNEPRFTSSAELLATMDAKSTFSPSNSKKSTELQPRKLNDYGWPTFTGVLDNWLHEGLADFLQISGNGSEPREFFRARDPLIKEADYKTAAAAFVALKNQAVVTIIELHGRLYDVISLPIKIPSSGYPLGTISFGVKNTVKDDFTRIVPCEFVLFKDGRIADSTLTDGHNKEIIRAETLNWETTLKLGKSATLNPIHAIKTLKLGNKYYRACFSRIDDPLSSSPFTYVIFSEDYDTSLKNLRATQHLIILLGLLAILLGSVVIWFVIRRATAPLNELRDSAEAVGMGDYTRRVPARTHDEFGELALGFNQMTENIQASRQQLEATVDRLKTAQAQLVQSEKLSGIGEFVAGVAHELNNPLTTVMGFSELLQQDKLDPKHQEFITLIHKNAQRCQRIVQSLLSFARRHQPERKPANLNKLIESALDILQYQLRTSNIELQLRLDPKLPLAMVDFHQIQQVLVNILNNARQSIETHSPKGLIKISTEPVGTHIRIRIQDSGPGISEENLSKIFDPFFTTKEVGKGTGLGLSLCYGIIKEHGGTIIPSSRPGQGAVFTIELPVTYELAPSPAATTVPMSTITNEGVGKRVLVIDDEEPILQMVREALTRHGYAVDIANNGETALARLRQNRYDIALCDWKMPGLTGQQVYERLRVLDPVLAQRLIFVTGDLVSEKTREFLDAEKKICLPKPFTLTEFRAAINQVLAN